MKFVLGVGWLTTAAREYREIGGPDRENVGQLGRAIDEYAMGAAFQQQLLNPMQADRRDPGRAAAHLVRAAGRRLAHPLRQPRHRVPVHGREHDLDLRHHGPVHRITARGHELQCAHRTSGITADNLSARVRSTSDRDGSFTITVSGAPAATGQRNHLQMTADTTLIAVRNTLSDWNSQPPMTLSIERLSGPRDSLFSQLGGFAIPAWGRW